MKAELINVRPDARVKSNGCNGTLEREEWRDVKGYEGLYQVSSFGRVRSAQTNQIRKLKTTRTGYIQIGLWNGGKRKDYAVHRLVMEAFVPNPHNLPQVNHRNEVKTSNYPDNMEWCTAHYNSNFGTKSKRGADKNRGQKRTSETCAKISEQRKRFFSEHPEARTEKSKQMRLHYANNPEARAKQREYTRKQMRPVVQLDKSGRFIREWDSASGAGHTLEISVSTIANCCAGRGRIKSYKGYIWKYKSDYENEQNK